MRASSWLSALLLLLVSADATPSPGSSGTLSKRQNSPGTTAPKLGQRVNSLPAIGSPPVVGTVQPGLKRVNSLPLTGTAPRPAGRLPGPGPGGLRRTGTLPVNGLGATAGKNGKQAVSGLNPVAGRPQLSPLNTGLQRGQQVKPGQVAPQSPTGLQGQKQAVPKGGLGGAPVPRPPVAGGSLGACLLGGRRLGKRCQDDNPMVSLLLCGPCGAMRRALLNILNNQCWKCYGDDQYTSAMIEQEAQEALRRYRTGDLVGYPKLDQRTNKMAPMNYPKPFGNRVGGPNNDQSAVITSHISTGILLEFPINVRGTYMGGDPGPDRVVIEVTPGAKATAQLMSIHVITHSRADGTAFKYISPTGGGRDPTSTEGLVETAPPPSIWGKRPT